MVTVTTGSGSRFDLDREARTWRRTAAGLGSGVLRDSGGPYLGVGWQMGGDLVILAPDLDGDPAMMRRIRASGVISVEGA